MPSRIVSIAPPPEPVVRVARRGVDPFGPPPWEYAAVDGTFGGRFDDPGGRVNPDRWRESVPVEQRFRVVYCATTTIGALGETLARFRPALSDAFIDPDYEDDADDPESVGTHLTGTRDPNDPRRGLISADWRSRRVIATTRLDRSLRYVDLASPATIGFLRTALAPVAQSLGLTDVDFGTVLSPIREFTQACSRYIYDLVDEQDNPRYAGIRYLSRLNPAWECWAIFDGRIRHTPVHLESVLPDDRALQEVAALFDLTVEASEGRYIRPAQ